MTSNRCFGAANIAEPIFDRIRLGSQLGARYLSAGTATTVTNDRVVARHYPKKQNTARGSPEMSTSNRSVCCLFSSVLLSIDDGARQFIPLAAVVPPPPQMKLT